MNVQTERPTSLTVIGWYWIITGILALIFAGIPMLVAITMLPAGGFFPAEHMNISFNMFSRGMADGMNHGPDQFIKPTIHVIRFIFNYFIWYYVLAFIMAVGGIIGGAGLLQLRSWGRQVIEIFSWIRAIEFVIAGVLTGIFWIATSMMTPYAGMPRELSMMGGFMDVILALLLMFWLFWIVVYGVMIYYLRKEENRYLVEESDIEDSGAGYSPRDEWGRQEW